MTPVYNQTYTEQERLEAAAAIWNAEKGKAFAIILLSWLSKVRSPLNVKLVPSSEVGLVLLCIIAIFIRYALAQRLLSSSSTFPLLFSSHLFRSCCL